MAVESAATLPDRTAGPLRGDRSRPRPRGARAPGLALVLTLASLGPAAGAPTTPAGPEPDREEWEGYEYEEAAAAPRPAVARRPLGTRRVAPTAGARPSVAALLARGRGRDQDADTVRGRIAAISPVVGAVVRRADDDAAPAGRPG